MVVAGTTAIELKNELLQTISRIDSKVNQLKANQKGRKGKVTPPCPCCNCKIKNGDEIGCEECELLICSDCMRKCEFCNERLCENCNEDEDTEVIQFCENCERIIFVQSALRMRPVISARKFSVKIVS